MQSVTEDRLQRKKRLFEFYGPKSKPSAELNELPKDPTNIDSSEFDAKIYMNNLLSKSDLNDLVAKETEICDQIRTLDSEMQTLVYDNYNKFINATHTIKMMKADFKYIEGEMNSLAESMLEIRLFSSDIDNELRDIRTPTKQLMTTADNLQKLGYLSSLPSKIRQFTKKEEWAKAVDAYVKAKAFFDRHRHVPSFRGIYNECTELIDVIINNVEDKLNSVEDAQTLNSLIEVLHQFGQSTPELAEKFLNVASHRSDILLENLATSHPSNSSEDILSFANAASDIISEGIMSYVFTYSSRFLSNRTLNNDQVDEDLETTLFDFLQGVTTKFLDFINAELQSRVESTEIDLLVRALERLYSRLMAFGRSVLEVVVPPNQSPSLSPNDFKKHLDEATLNMVLIVAENCCRKKQFQALKVQTADCLTDVRQKLVTSVCLKPKKEQVLVFF
nr:hypothetical transcript [Hymenolepis microstoma]